MVAARIKQIQSFMAITQMVMMPMYFLSGAIFPVVGAAAVADDPQPAGPDDLRGRPDAADRSSATCTSAPRARRALDPGVTWWGWHVPGLLEAAVVAAASASCAGVAIVEFSRASSGGAPLLRVERASRGRLAGGVLVAIRFAVVSSRGRRLAFGSAALAVLAGIACAVLVPGIVGEVLTIALVGLGLTAALLLVFLEIGLEEERDLEDERRGRDEQARRRLALRSGSRLPRRPRRPQ